MESRLAEDKSDAAHELQIPKKKDEAQKISIVSVTTGKGLTKAEILKVTQTNLSEIEKLGTHIEMILKDVPGTRSIYAERTAGGYFLDFKLNSFYVYNCEHFDTKLIFW